MDRLVRTGELVVRPAQIVSGEDGRNVRYRYFVRLEDRRGRLPPLEGVLELELHPKHGVSFRLVEATWKQRALTHYEAQRTLQNLLMRIAEHYLRSLIQASVWREDQWARGHGEWNA